MPDVPLAVGSAMDGATLLGFPLWLPRWFPFPELVRYYFLSFLSCRQLQELGTEVQYAREVSSASYHQGDAACFCTLSAFGYRGSVDFRCREENKWHVRMFATIVNHTTKVIVNAKHGFSFDHIEPIYVHLVSIY